MAEIDESKRRTLKLFAGAAGAGLAAGVFPQAVLASDLTKREHYTGFLVEAETGRTLYARNADTPRQWSSFVKVPLIMLAIDAVEAGHARWEDEIEVTAEMTAVTRSEENYPTRFLPDKIMTLRQHVDAMIVKSMNESAMAVAAYLAGGRGSFGQKERDCAALIEEKVRALGGESSIVRNATGYFHPEQLTTARDQSRIAQHLIYAYADYYPMFSKTDVELGGEVFRSSNQYLTNSKYRDGIKTGSLSATGVNLIGSEKRQDKRIIVVSYGGVSGKEIADHAAFLSGLGLERHSQEFPGLDEPMSDSARCRNVEKLGERAANPFGEKAKTNDSAPESFPPPFGFEGHSPA